MTTEKEVHPTRERIRHEIAQFPSIIEQDPHKWWRSTAKMLIGIRQRLQTESDPEVKEYFNEYIRRSLDMLRQSTKYSDIREEVIVEKADHMIMNISMEMASQFEQKNLAIKTHFLPITELIGVKPDRFKIDERVIGSVDCIILNVKHPTKDMWQEVPLPKNLKIWHKGGPARAVLDIIADAPLTMQQSEIPWNDFDAIVAGKSRETKAAIEIGVDSDGIEHMGEENINFERYCYGRDTQQNQVCLGADGLYYSQFAYTSAITGHVNTVGEYVANKAIYGIDRMTYHGISMSKQCGLMRLVKAVTEGKALSFDHIPLNSNFDMGVYVLFLAKRWSGKEKFPEFMQKMYFLLKQMGQTREGEEDIFEVLERTHRESPFFDFDSEVRLPIEVVRWKSRKIVKQIDREAAWKFGFPSMLDVQRTPDDLIPSRISLDGFILDTEKLDIKKQWEMFVERSRKRTTIQIEKEKSAYDKIFGVSFDVTDELGVGFDDLIFLEESVRN